MSESAILTLALTFALLLAWYRTRPNLTLDILIVDAHNNYLYYGGKRGKQYAAWEEQLSADMASFENPDVDETIGEIHKYVVFGIDG